MSGPASRETTSRRRASHQKAARGEAGEVSCALRCGRWSTARDVACRGRGAFRCRSRGAGRHSDRISWRTRDGRRRLSGGALGGGACAAGGLGVLGPGRSLSARDRDHDIAAVLTGNADLDAGRLHGHATLAGDSHLDAWRLDRDTRAWLRRGGRRRSRCGSRSLLGRGSITPPNAAAPMTASPATSGPSEPPSSRTSPLGL